MEMNRVARTDAGLHLFRRHAYIDKQFIGRCRCCLVIKGFRHAADYAAVYLSVKTGNPHSSARQYTGVYTAALFEKKEPFFGHLAYHQSHLIQMGIQKQNRRTFFSAGFITNQIAEPVHFHPVHIWFQKFPSRLCHLGFPAGNPIKVRKQHGFFDEFLSAFFFHVSTSCRGLFLPTLYHLSRKKKRDGAGRP